MTHVSKAKQASNRIRGASKSVNLVLVPVRNLFYALWGVQGIVEFLVLEFFKNNKNKNKNGKNYCNRGILD